MNRLIITGVIRNIKYLGESVIVYVDDIEKGYRTSGGVSVDDILYTWKVVFKANPFKAYINKHFNDGMLVDIDARMRPYAIVNGSVTDGYSCFGISINRSCYVRASYRKEVTMIKDSQETSDEKPNLEEFNQPSF